MSFIARRSINAQMFGLMLVTELKKHLGWEMSSIVFNSPVDPQQHLPHQDLDEGEPPRTLISIMIAGLKKKTKTNRSVLNIKLKLTFLPRWFSFGFFVPSLYTQ